MKKPSPNPVDPAPNSIMSGVHGDLPPVLSSEITSIFYINRDCDQLRRASIEGQLSKARIHGERISAVEGLAVPRSLERFFFNDGKLCSQLSPAEVGTYASHLKAAQTVIERKLEHALILEDDAEVPDDLAECLNGIFAQLAAHWDFVHLCGDALFATKAIAHLKPRGLLVRYSRIPSGAFGYLISQSGAEKFLKPLKRHWPVDTDLRQPWRFGLQVYGVMPPLIKHSGIFPSTIAVAAKSERSQLRRGLPLPSRHCWTGNPLHTPQGFFFNLTRLGPLSWARCWLSNFRRRFMRIVASSRGGEQIL